MKAATLVMGRTYFRLTFADQGLTMPGVEPVVYLGEVADVGGTQGFVFQDTSSYVHHGSGLEGDEQHEDIVLYFLAEADLGALYSVEELAVEVAESAQRAASQNYPKLEPHRATQ